MTLPNDFFATNQADEHLETLNDNLQRIKEGPYKEDIIQWHISHTSPTFGLIVAGRTPDGQWKYYWHSQSRIGDCTTEAEYPVVFKRYKSAVKRAAELNDPQSEWRVFVPLGTVFEVVVWSHPDVGTCPWLERYSDIKRRFPGSPTQ